MDWPIVGGNRVFAQPPGHGVNLACDECRRAVFVLHRNGDHVMPAKPKTPDEYLPRLPPDRRSAIQAVREVILKNLDKDYVEGIQYGMIGYYVPHSLYPPGYHCDPKLPLSMGWIGSQKNHMSLYLM